ncbi:MAG: sigma 54-interacting transcriptional regulator [Thermodesulfobacteriota bacterium]|nr:sigma 54-interacting transcriptional regulator [Thermodesulfobacteriota bacterium]
MKKTDTPVLYANFADLLLEFMADGVFTVNKRGLISSWNTSMERITGYTAEDVIGRTCDIIGFDRCFGKACPTGIKECKIYSIKNIDGKECFLRHKNGTDIPVIKSARIFKGNHNKVAGVVETVTDMSELYRARQAVEEANRKLGEIHRFDKIIGKSTAIRKMLFSIKAAITSDATVLIQGESGTGKELAAGAIHYNSRRKEGPFVAVNCSALSESLLESELFGHVKGSFTGAVRDRAGRFEEAETGTLFLDEIGEISPYIQVKLIRVLQEREVERVGDSRKRKVDIRVIGATNRDLIQLVNDGRFREDLYYRLKVFPIHIPPLRERKKDIPLLTSHFINLQNDKTGKKITGVSQPAMRLLLDYDWPGNVRELENAIEHAFVLCENNHIDIFDLPVEIRRMEFSVRSKRVVSANPAPRKDRKKLTRRRLIEILEASDWNKAEVGRQLGLSRASIWKYMRKWDIPMQKP